MPLHLNEVTNDGGELGLWRITEDISFFLENLTLFAEEKLELDALSERKKIEWLASRYLLHHMLGSKDRMPCTKDRYGKPHIMHMDLEISLSHSREFVAVIISKNLCGVDVQYFINKIHRIAPKFINTVEWPMTQGNNALENMHVIWGAKEAIYKAYGRKGLDFKNEIKIDPFVYDKNGFTFSGFLQRETFTMEFACNATLIEDFTLVYAAQI